MEEFWQTEGPQRIRINGKADNKGELIQLDIRIGTIAPTLSRFVLDRAEFQGLVKMLLRLDEKIARKYEKLPPGTLDPRD